MPKGNESTTKFKADISQLKAAMQEAARQVRLANSEFKAATAGMDNWSDSADGLSAKIKQLDKVLAAQNKQLDSLQEQYELTAKEQGENSKGAQELAIKINNQKAAIGKTESQLKTYADKLGDVDKSADEAGDSAQQLAKDVGDVDDAVKKTSDGFTVMKGALASLVADGIRTAISAIKDLAKETLQVGMGFESAMSQVEAVSGATGDELEALTAKAKEMGEKTKFSASESAEAFNYMAMAGWKTEDMLNGIEGIMNLAAASGSDLATTSDIVTDALTAMGYSAGDAGKLADVMAAASSNANTNVEMMGATFQYAAPIVGALGYNMEDTAVAIGMMANAGIKGEKAGTALRSILTRLSAPPKECAEQMEALGISITDTNGEMKPLATVMQDLRKKLKGLSKDQQTAAAKALAGQEAMSGLLAVVNGADADFEKLTNAVKDSTGAAEDMANTMNDNVQGQLTLLRSQIEGKMIQVYEKASDKIKEAIHQISRALEQVDWDKVGDAVGRFATKVVDLMVYVIKNGDTIIKTIKAIVITLGTLWALNKYAQFISGINTLTKAFSTTKTAVDLLKASQLGLNAAQLASPAGLVITALAAMAAGMIYARKQFEKQIETEYGLNDAQKETIENAREMAKAYSDMDSARNEANSGVSAEYGHLEELKDEYNSLIDSNGEVKEGYEDRANFIINQLAEAMGVEQEEIRKTIDENGKLGKSIDDLMLKKQAEATLNANESYYQEAIEKRSEALKKYQDALATAEQAEKTYADAKAQGNNALETYNELLTNNPAYADDFYWANRKIIEGQKEAKKALDEANGAVKEAEGAYVGYNSTISNYEGLSAASISGDASKIKVALGQVQNDFITAKNGTKATLEQQVKDYSAHYGSLKKAIEDGTPGVTQSMVDQAEMMVRMAKNELAKLPADASETGKKSGEAFADGMKSTTQFTAGAGQILADNAKEGAQTGEKKLSETGKLGGSAFAKGVDSQQGKAKTAGANETKATASGAQGAVGQMNAAGQYTSIQYVSGVNSKQSQAKTAGTDLANKANEGVKSVDTTESGKFFGQGFINGIGSLAQSAWNAAENLAKKAWDGLKKGQKEGSPSKLTYQSGVYFTQGYINGIASMQTGLVNTVKSLAGVAVKELLNMSNYDFATAGSNASEAFANGFSKKLEYTTNKMTYQNERKLAEFDAAVEKLKAQQDKDTKAAEKKSTAKQTSLEKARDKKVTALQKKYDAETDKKKKAKLKKDIQKTKDSYSKKIKNEQASLKKQQAKIKSTYEALVKEQEEQKSAYQEASSAMLSEFSQAMSEYQSKAQNLIDSTMNGITDKYQAQYDALIDKQDSLIEKMKSAGELFEISGAGVITVNDINEQTKQIQEYASKLEKIKAKVSSDLFDQITSYDMKEGSAFIDQLLGLSEEDLKAYSDAYDKKMSMAESLAQNLYKKDFENVSKEYTNAVNQAFKNLPKQLEELGVQSMKGFLSGLTTNTDYMESAVKTYIKGMVDTFKKELDIHSPSKVMAKLGEFTGEGFGNGLKDMVGYVKDSASKLVDATNASMGDVKSALGSASFGGSGVGTTSVVNNYNLVQNNTSPKSLSALETYQARRQQIALVKAFT